MRGGQLRTRITILQPALVGGINTWDSAASIVKTVSGTVETLQGSEQAPGGLGPPNMRASLVTIRHPRSSFTVLPRMRLTFEGRTLEIDAVDPDQRKRSLQLSCREVTG
jgi:head-tail adaptor